MISSKEANPTLNSLAECINVSISDKEFSFQYPASEYMRNVVIEILQGKAYSNAIELHRGTNGYVSKSLKSHHPHSDMNSI